MWQVSQNASTWYSTNRILARPHHHRFSLIAVRSATTTTAFFNHHHRCFEITTTALPPPFQRPPPPLCSTAGSFQISSILTSLQYVKKDASWRQLAMHSWISRELPSTKSILPSAVQCCHESFCQYQCQFNQVFDDTIKG